MSAAIEQTAQRADVLASAADAVRGWGNAPAADDPHATAVAEVALEIAEQLGVELSRRFAVAAGALLHDVGKELLDQTILDKPGPLDAHERRHVETHPQAGASALAPTIPPCIREIVRCHHERWDGAGYPDGLGAAAIPLEARIVAVADAFQAMRENRPYRSARTHGEAVAEVMRAAGTQFDPACVRAFAQLPRTGRQHLARA